MAKATAVQSITVDHFLGLTAEPIVDDTIEAASQTWKKGAPVKYVAGLVTEIVETDVVGIIGVCGHNASGVTSKPVKVVGTIGVVFCAELSAVSTGLHTLAQADIGTEYGLDKTTDGKWFIDYDDLGAEQTVRIIGNKDPIGTVNGLVYFVFKNSVTIFN